MCIFSHNYEIIHAEPTLIDTYVFGAPVGMPCRGYDTMRKCRDCGKVAYKCVSERDYGAFFEATRWEKLNATKKSTVK